MKFRIKQILLHLLIWVLIFILNLLFMRSFVYNFNINYHILIWMLYFIAFYVNYLVLIPFLLFHKKIFLYLIFSIALLFGSYFAKNTIMKKTFEEATFSIEISSDSNSIIEEAHPNRNRAVKNLLNRKGLRPITFIFLGILFSYLISLLLKLLQKWYNEEKYRAELENEKLVTELTLLKEQINPHFLFNSLNNIYSLSISKSDKVTTAILKLSSILRYFLYENVDSIVYLKDEISVINDYIELQKLRINEKVTLSFNVVGNPEYCKIEPFIIMPLIENTFKFGNDNVNESFIDIAIIIMNNKLGLKIQNKIVYKPKAKDPNSGIGIKNIKRRLDLLYPGKYKFNIGESEGVFTTHLEIKLKK